MLSTYGAWAGSRNWVEESGRALKAQERRRRGREYKGGIWRGVILSPLGRGLSAPPRKKIFGPEVRILVILRSI